MCKGTKNEDNWAWEKKDHLIIYRYKMKGTLLLKVGDTDKVKQLCSKHYNIH